MAAAKPTHSHFFSRALELNQGLLSKKKLKINNHWLDARERFRV